MNVEQVKVGDKLAWPDGHMLTVVELEDMYASYTAPGEPKLRVGIKMVLFRERDGQSFDLTIYDS